MKKVFTLSVMLSLVTLICAQGVKKVTATGPTFLEEFNANDITVAGINYDGRFVYGVNSSSSAFIYDFNNLENPLTTIEATESDYFGISVAGVTQDGNALVSHYSRSYFLNLKDKSTLEIVSPDENYGLDAWTMTADGKYIGCNLTTEDFFVIPMLAEKQEDGTYKMIYLEYDPNDAMGCVAQYTQVRFISNDAKYVIGIQPDNRGMGGRLVVWVKQEDGSYKFTTPMDDFLYDLSMNKPGLAPEWDDFVTADSETEPELFEQQSEAFNKAFEEYELNYNKFTRNNSALEIYMMNKSARNNIICMAFYDNRTNSENNMIPVFYDCEKGKISEFPELINSFGFNALPGGGFIAATDNGGLYSLTAINAEEKGQPFETWFKEVTGTNLADSYTFTFTDYMNDQEITGVFPGLPFFSEDGKSLVFSGTDPDLGTTASVFTFDDDIFASTASGIKVNVANEVSFGNNKIMIGAGRQGVADVYSLNGTKCGSYMINGTFDFNGVLANGTYVVRMNVEGEEPISMKIIVK